MTKNKNEIFDRIVSILQEKTKDFPPSLIEQVFAEFGYNPFLILIACLLSLRAKDTTTIYVCRKVFTKAQTPTQLLKISRSELEKIVFKIGFYRNRAQVLHDVSRVLVEEYDSKVPSTFSQLIGIKGVGRKTANLVLGLAFNKLAICVDTHVHRISNRLGLIKTKTVEQTEEALKKILPQKYWIVWNRWLVVWGQNLCTPLSPCCSICSLSQLCKKVDVFKSR